MLRLKRRARAQVILFREGTWNLRWIITSCALALAGFIGLLTQVPVWVQIALGLISVTLVAMDIYNHRAESRRTHFQPRPTDDFTKVINSYTDNKEFIVRSFRAGTLIIDKSISDALLTDTFVSSSEESAYIIPYEFRSLGNLYRRTRVVRNPNAYNDPVLGFSSLSTTGPTPILKTVEAFYWDHLATDQLAMVDTRVGKEFQDNLGRSLFITRDDELRDLSSSWILNTIGVSVLAITTDGQFVVVTQSANNDGSVGLYAPTGSGSLEPQDYRGAYDLPASKLFENGAMREAAEESAIDSNEVDAVLSLGFGRWLEKAAKPEAFFIAFLNVDSHAVRRKRIPAADRPYTSLSEPRRFQLEDPRQWSSHAAPDMVDAEVARSLSMPLEACLSLLAEAVESGDEEICRLLGPRLKTTLVPLNYS